MKASRLLLACAFFLASAPAHAHGGPALTVFLVVLTAPFLILIFLPICAMSGMAGRRWKAFGLYLVVLAAALVLQWQPWYQPFARMFPRPVWLEELLPRFVLTPPLDLLIWLALAVIAIYLVLRDRSVPIGVALTLPPAGNLLWGSAFTIAGFAVWAYVLFNPQATSRIASWPEGIAMPFLLIWAFILPVVLAFTAIHLFRNGLRFRRNRSPR